MRRHAHRTIRQEARPYSRPTSTSDNVKVSKAPPRGRNVAVEKADHLFGVYTSDHFGESSGTEPPRERGREAEVSLVSGSSSGPPGGWADWDGLGWAGRRWVGLGWAGIRYDGMG